MSKARVLVAGDVYLDENVFGEVTGVSLEAPIPVFEVHERRYNPGAAGNAACNMAALGAQTYAVGVIGNDANAAILREEFAKRNVDAGGLVVDETRPTNTYGKLRAGTFNAPSQEVLRTDTPRPPLIGGSIEQAVLEQMRRLAPLVDAIVVVDQVSSVASPAVLTEAVRLAREHGLLTVGDSRERAVLFQGFDVLVPNDREAGIGAGIDVIDDAALHEAAQRLLNVCETAMITRGPKGITVFNRAGEADVPARIVDAVDVTGAGDTVTAAVTCALCAGAKAVEAAEIGNAAAGIAVRQRGVVTVPAASLEAALLRGERPAKLKTRTELADLVARLKQEGRRVVWTNGCFDLLHAGHLTYLHKAGLLGDVLVIGLNSDASVQELKGPARPIINETDRALILSELECVDYLTFFGEDNVVPLLELLEPDVYVKGGDYTIDTINQEERRVVEAYGGAIEIIPGVEGQSTSALIERILQAEGHAPK